MLLSPKRWAVKPREAWDGEFLSHSRPYCSSPNAYRTVSEHKTASHACNIFRRRPGVFIKLNYFPSLNLSWWSHFLGFLWLCFASLYDWSIKRVPLFQPTKCNLILILVMATRVFPRFKQFACFYFEFSCVRGDIFHEHCCDYFAFGFTSLNQKKIISFQNTWWKGVACENLISSYSAQFKSITSCLFSLLFVGFPSFFRYTCCER